MYSSSADIFNELTTIEHDNILRYSNARAGLKVIIAFHKPMHGVAMGATRMLPYASEGHALADALKLSEAMTHKAACAGIPVGGAKATIIADPRRKSDAMLRAYAHYINGLRGQFITGQDLNLTLNDVRFMAQETRYMVGVEPSSLSPALATAMGVLNGIKGALRAHLDTTSLDGVRVAVQGVGSVGGHLVEMLVNAGAKVILADHDDSKAQDLAFRFGAKVVEPEEIYTQDVEVFAPCGLGGVLNATTIPLLKASIVAGAANNQLADPKRDGYLLKEHEIAYSPDFVINAGGLIDVYCEYAKLPLRKTHEMIANIESTIERIVRETEKSDLCAHTVAVNLARFRRDNLESNLSMTQSIDLNSSVRTQNFLEG